MPYIINFTRWPSDAIPEVVKKAIDATKKFPPDESLGESVVPNAIKGTLDGVRTISVTLVKEGKLEEALARSMAIANMYATIPGFEYSIETWATIEEAYASVGQKPPE